MASQHQININGRIGWNEIDVDPLIIGQRLTVIPKKYTQGIGLQQGTTTTWSGTVSASQTPTETIYVKDGQSIHVEATGTWKNHPTSTIGPNGKSLISLPSGNFRINNKQILYSLVGRIDTGPWFFIGEEQDIIADRDGILYLGMNDDWWNDNSGSLNATVAVTGYECSGKLISSAASDVIVAQIGDNTPFVVGEEYDEIISQSGQLYLSLNECDDKYQSALIIIDAPDESEDDGDCQEGSDTAKVQSINPIQLRTGNKVQTETDLILQTPSGELTLTRYYRQTQQVDPLYQFMGLGWSHNHAYKLVFSGSSSTRVATISLPSGGQVKFDEDGTANSFDVKPGSHATLTYDDTEQVYVYEIPSGKQYIFDDSTKGAIPDTVTAYHPLIKQVWKSGEEWSYSYSGNNLTKVEDLYGNYLQFEYHSGHSGDESYKNGLLWRVGDHDVSNLGTSPIGGRYVEYDFEPQHSNGNPISDPLGLLTEVDDILRKVWTYEYFGQQVGETTSDQLDWLIKRLSPSVDTDGDEQLDGALTLEQLIYTTDGSGTVESIEQQRGEGLQTNDFVFQENGLNITSVESAGIREIHHFANGVYVGKSNSYQELPWQVLNDNYRPQTQSDANGNETSLDWINDGKNLSKVTDANSNETGFTYDVSDRLLTSTDAEGRKTEYTYDDVTYPDLRQPETIKVKDVSDNLLRMQEFVYDSKGRTTSEKEIDPSDETTVLREVTRSFYTSGDGNGLLEKLTIIDQDASNDQETTYTYDSVGRVIQVQKNSTFGSCEISYTVYDDAGNVVASICNYDPGMGSAPTNASEAAALYSSSTPDKNQVTTHEYDAMGRRVKTTTNAGSSFAKTTLVIYDALSRVVRQISNYEDSSYEAPGGWVFESGVWKDEASGTTISHGSDLNENIISSTDYNERGLVRWTQDHLGQVTLYGYDDADRLIKTIQNASDVDYNNTYTDDTSTTPDPDLSEYVEDTSAPDIDIITEQVYDAVGNLVKTIDPAGRVSFTVYDALNRPIKGVQNAKATATIDLNVGDAGYDATLDPQSASYVISTDPDRDQVSETEYDSLGRVIRTKRLLDKYGTTETWDYTLIGYDALGRQVKTIAHALDNDYDISSDPDLSEYSASSNTDVDIISETFYNVQGQVSYTKDSEGRETHYAYDGLQRQMLTVGNFNDNSYQDIANWVWDDVTDNRWEDGANTAIAFGSTNDENIIAHTNYDDNGYVTFTRDIDGRIQRFVYDDLGRQVRTIQNFVDNGETPSDWVWDGTTDNRWEESDGTAIDHGSHDDENVISETVYDDQGRVQSTRDHLGNVTLYGYDSANRRIKVVQNASNPSYDVDTDPDLSAYTGSSPDDDQDRISSTVYDGAGRVQSTVVSNNNATYFVYDELGRRIRTIQNYVSNGEDPSLWLWDDTDRRYEESDGTAIAHTSDFDENLITETVYNKAGQVVLTRDARGTQTTFNYDNSGRRVSVIQASNTVVASISYTCFDKAGRVLRMIANWQDDAADPVERDASGDWVWIPILNGRHNDQNIITAYEYDNASRRVMVINANGDDSQTTYFKDGTVDTVTDPEGVVTAYRYDALRRRTRVIQNYVSNGEDPTLWVWDAVTDNRWEESDGTAIAHGADNDQNVIVDVSYDILGRMEQLRDPRGHVTSYEYDNLGRRTKLMNPLSKEWVTAYENNGNVTKTTMTYPGINGGSSYSVEREFDRLGRLTEIDYSDLSNTPTVQFTYDADGNRQKMTELGTSTAIRETTYGYDELGRLTSVGFNTDGTDAIEETVSYEYDISGNRTTLILPNADEINYTYDAQGRLVSMTDWDDQVSTFQYDKLGRHVGTQRSNGFTSKYAYNKAGHLQELRHGEGWNTVKTLQSFVYETDARGNRTQAKEISLRDTAGSSVTMAHDDESIVYSGDWDTVEVSSTFYKETSETNAKLAVMFFGNTGINLTMGTGNDCGIYDVYINQTLWQSYDGYASSAGEDVIALEVKGDGAHLLEVYQRREKNSASSGYTVRFKQLVALEAYDVETIDYTYDNLSRLLEADYDSGSTVYTYGYDLAGNLVNNNGTTRTFNSANQLTGNGTDTFDYDNNGNLWKTNSVVSHTWDRANRLLSHGGLDYAYDGLGNRISQDNGTDVTKYLLDLQSGLPKVLSETVGANVTRFVHSPRGLHATQNPADAWFYSLQDGLGSQRAEISANVAVVGSQEFTPYGVVQNVTGSFNSPHAFTGEPLDANGLQYHRARYYAPEMGVWASLDPLETANRYGYVGGNPTNLVDPTGNLDELPSDYASCTSDFAYSGNREVRQYRRRRPRFQTPRPTNTPNARLLRTPTPTSTPESPLGVVHVSCNLSTDFPSARPKGYAVVRNFPSFDGEVRVYIAQGANFNYYEEQPDYPSNGVSPSSWLRLTPNNLLDNGQHQWVRRSVNGINIIENGFADESCAVSSGNRLHPTGYAPTATPASSASVSASLCNTNACAVGNTTCPPQSNAEDIIAFVLACESGNDFAQAVDIAHVIRNRTLAGGRFGETALEVVTEAGEFDCWICGSSSPISPSASFKDLASSLVNNNGASLPMASSPDIQRKALYFQGNGIYTENPEQSNVISDLSFCEADLNNIYVGHSNRNSNGFLTAFFSDAPQC